MAGLAVCFLLLAASLAAAAQEHDGSRIPVKETDSLEILVYFEKGYSSFNPAYKKNGERLLKFIREVDFKDTLHIRGTASPEGEWKLNDRLSIRRAESLRSYIMENAAIDGPVLIVGGDGIDWAGLRSMAMESSMPHKEKVLKVISGVLSGRIQPENANKSLLYIGDGEAWWYMYRNFFPQLRTVSFRTWGDPPPTIIGHRQGAAYVEAEHEEESSAIVSGNSGREVTPVSGEADVAHDDCQDSDAGASGVQEEAVVQEEAMVQDASRTGLDETVGNEPFHRFAVKTNLLYDAALMPNLEFEWLINEHWSVSVDGNVAWWKNAQKHQYYQALIISPECRWWFKTFKPWHGHYMGLMAGGGLYDLENKRTGYRGEAGFAGLTYGFMWPIARSLSFDAEIGAGYMYTKFEEYEPVDNHYVYQRTRSMNYVGPLKLKFSLVWRFADMSGKKKGGAK